MELVNPHALSDGHGYWRRMEQKLGISPPAVLLHSPQQLPRSSSRLRAQLPKADGEFIPQNLPDNTLKYRTPVSRDTWVLDGSGDPTSPVAAPKGDPDPRVIKTRNKHVWLTPGVTADDVRGKTQIATKDDWANEDKYFSQHQSLPWAQRRKAIEYVVSAADDPTDALSRVTHTLDVLDYNTILRRFATHRKWRELYLAFVWMKQNDKLNPPCFTTFISSMGKAGFPSRALQAFKSQSEPAVRLNIIVCNALFKALVFNGKVDAAFVLFEQLKCEGLVPNFDTYKALIAGCSRHRGAYAKANTFVEEMIGLGLQPDSFIFTSLLNVCASFGLEEEAKGILQKMTELGVAKNNYHYSAMLNVYAEIRKPEEAENLVSEIQQRCVPLDKTILSTLLKAYTNSGLLEKARNFFDGLEAQGFPPQEVSYCLMMDAYVKAGKVDEAENLFNEIKTKRIKLGSYTYCIMISAYSKLGKIDDVESLVEELEGLPRESLDVVLFNNLLKTYSELGMMEGILKTIKKMDKAEVAPDRATFNILINYFSKQELFDLARRTLQDLLNRRLRPNLNSYAPIIMGLLSTGNIEKAFTVYNEMRVLNISASPSLAEALLEGLCKSKRFQEALSFMKEMKANGFSLQSTILESLFISTAGNVELALEVFKASDVKSLEAVNFNAVLMSYEGQGHLETLPKMLEYMKEHGCHASQDVWNHFQDNLIERLHSRDEDHTKQ